MLLILLFLTAHWYASLFAQTLFQHRYAAHRMFTMSRGWERLFFLLTFLAQGSSFMSPRGYALLHRLHHAFSDTAQDPHSPHHAANAFSMMWKTRTVYQDMLVGESAAARRFADQEYPEWRWLETAGHQWYVRLGWGVLYALFYAQFATSWWQFLFLPLHFSMGAIHGAIVNWCGHKYGYQNFDNHDQSRNTLALDFLAGGELFQNNHHKLPSRANFGVKWWEVDPTYGLIWGLSKLRIIKLRN